MNSQERNAVRAAAIRYTIINRAREQLRLASGYTKGTPPRVVEEALEVVNLWLRAESAIDLESVLSGLGMNASCDPERAAEHMLKAWETEARPCSPIAQAVEKIAGGAS